MTGEPSPARARSASCQAPEHVQGCSAHRPADVPEASNGHLPSGLGRRWESLFDELITFNPQDSRWKSEGQEKEKGRRPGIRARRKEKEYVTANI